MKIDAHSQEFIESMGLVYQSDGLPRIAGRILALLMIQDKPCSLQQLADALEVSRGSVSTNTRLLEQFGMIERVAKSGDRQGFYQLSPNPYPNALQAAVQRMTKAKQIVVKAIERIPKKSAGATRNLSELDQFYDIAIKGINTIIRDYSDAVGE